MDRVVSGVALVELERAQILERVVQLRVQVLPLAHAQVGKKVLLAELPPLALRAQPFPLVVDGVPDVEQREEVGLRIGEALVRGGGGVLLLERAFARVLDAQAGGDDEQFARGVFAAATGAACGRAWDRSAAARGRRPSGVSSRCFVQRAEFLEQRVAAVRWRRAWAD